MSRLQALKFRIILVAAPLGAAGLALLDLLFHAVGLPHIGGH